MIDIADRRILLLLSTKIIHIVTNNEWTIMYILTNTFCEPISRTDRTPANGFILVEHHHTSFS